MSLRNLSKKLTQHQSVWPNGQTLSMGLEEFLQRLPSTPRKTYSLMLNQLEAEPVEFLHHPRNGTLYRLSVGTPSDCVLPQLIMAVKGDTATVRPASVSRKTLVEFYQDSNEEHWMSSPNSDDFWEEYEEFRINIKDFENTQVPEWTVIRACFVAHGCRRDQYNDYINGVGKSPECVKRGVALSARLQDNEGFIRSTTYLDALVKLNRELHRTIPQADPFSHKVTNARHTIYEYLRTKCFLQRLKQTEANK